MELTLSTPALFFSAISLLMLVYTNRFLALAQLVRKLHNQYKEKPDEIILRQIQYLRRRLYLIRSMQIYCITSLLVCVLCTFLIYIKAIWVAEVLFGFAMILLIIALILYIREIQISVKALNLNLSDIEKIEKRS